MKIKIFLFFAVLALFYSHQPSVSAEDVQCSNPNMFAQATIFIKIENSDGTLNSYSNDFSFDISASDNQAGSGIDAFEWPKSILSPRDTVTSDWLKPIGPTETVVANTTWDDVHGSIRSCDPPGSSTPVNSYPMNYNNGNVSLNCMSSYTVDENNHLLSARFTFSNPVVRGVGAGFWVNSAATTISPSAANALNTQAVHKIEWVYRLSPPPAPANVAPESYLSVTPGGPLLRMNQTTDRRSGVAEFYDAITASSFGGANSTVNTSSYTYTTAAGVCNRAGPWVRVGGNAINVNSNGGFDAYPRTNAPFNRKTDNTICHLIVIDGVSAGGGLGAEEMRTATISPRTPATISVSSTASAGTIDAQNGNVAFTHTINLSDYGYMDHNVSYVIEQATGPLGTFACTSGWAQIASGAQFFDSTADTSRTVYGPANAAFDRNTTQQVCQRIRVTDTGGANGGGTAEASAVVAAGVLTVNAVAPGGSVSPGETISPIRGEVITRADANNTFPMTYTVSFRTTAPIAGYAPPAAYASPVHTVTTAAQTFSYTPPPVVLPNSVPPGTSFCVRVSVTNPTLTRYFTAGVSSVESCVLIANKPVYMVNGGDLLAGAAVDTGTCGSGSTSSTIGGWNTGIAPYQGASTQLSAFARDGIIGFATAARGTIGVSPPSGLSFANVSIPAGNYGSAFGRVPCITNQWIPVTSPGPITTPEIGTAAKGDGIFTLPANSTIGGITVANGVQQVIYVPGNLTISGNIVYNRSGWTKLGQIPGLKIVLTNGGSLTITNAVTQVDGIYATEGDINTCERTNTTEYFDFCANKLVVNGSFIAQGKVNLKRSFGDLRTSSPGNVAEEFNYRPEIWLANWPKINESLTSDSKFDGVSSLPPVL